MASETRFASLDGNSLICRIQGMQTLTLFGYDAYVHEDYVINLNTAVLTTNVKPLRFPNDSVVYIYK